MSRILVIGGTGNVGGHVVRQLSARGARVRVMTHKTGAAGLPPDTEMVRGDLTDPQSLEPCLKGVATVFLVWVAPVATAPEAVQTIARCARRIVFLNAPLKTPHPFFQQPNPVRDRSECLERLIAASGLEWTFLRAGMFAGNARHFRGRRFGPAQPCAGPTSTFPRRQRTSGIWPRSRSAHSAKTGTPERSMSLPGPRR